MKVFTAKTIFYFEAMKNLYLMMLVCVSASLVVSSILLSRMWVSAKRKSNANSLKSTSELSAHIRITENNFPETVVRAHLPGFTVLENVYLKDGQWYLVTDKDIPPVTQMAQATKFNLMTKVEALQTFGNSYVSTVTGDSYLFSEPKPMLMQAHYFHIQEFIMGMVMINSLANISTNPRLLLFPTQEDTTETRVGWRDVPGLNHRLLTLLFPNANYIAAEAFDRWYNQVPFTRLFERIVVADRQSAHAYPLNTYWNGMYLHLQVALAGKPIAWPEIRDRVLRTLGVVTDRKRPAITYMSREHDGNRKFEEETNMQLKEGLKQFEPDYKTNYVIMAPIPFWKQVELIAQTDVLVSIHGNGLTHAIWLQPGSTIIEIFPNRNFVRDYECISTLLNLNYYAMHDNIVYEREEIVAKGFDNHLMNTPPDPVKLHVPTLMNLIQSLPKRT